MEEEIFITVNEPQQKSEIGGVNKFFLYHLKGKDPKGQIDINRRYSDFNVLREVLVKRWPGYCIPSLPQKKTIGSAQHIFIESRRRGLQIFLQTLTLSPCIWDSEELNIFLRNSSSDMEKQLSSLLKESTQKLYAKYRSVFVEFDKNQIPPNVPVKISEFNSYLKDSRMFLQKLMDSTENMLSVFKSNFQKKLGVLQFVLPDYERNCLVENDESKKADNLIFANQDLEIKSVLDKYKNVHDYPSVLLITEEIKREKRQLQAFEEVIKVMHEFQAHKLKSTNKVKDIELKGSKINAGKESLFSKIKKQTKEEQMAENQHEMEKAQEEEKMYTTLTQIITNLIGLKEIDRFKMIRQKAYFKMLKTFGEAEKEMVKAETQIWSRVSEHERIGEASQTLAFKNQPKEEVTEKEQTKGQEE